MTPEHSKDLTYNYNANRIANLTGNFMKVNENVTKKMSDGLKLTVDLTVNALATRDVSQTYGEGDPKWQEQLITALYEINEGESLKHFGIEDGSFYSETSASNAARFALSYLENLGFNTSLLQTDADR